MLYNSNEIQQIIPHRYPFLLVDAIESINEEGTAIIGRKCVSANEMQFLGHFPQKHLLPGVLIVEALAQTGCVLLLSKEENKGKLGVFAGINKMRFRRPVIPGDVMRLEVKLTNQRAGIYFADVCASVDGEVVEAAIVDGANRMQKILYIHIPTILPTIVILLIMNTGSLLSVGYEKVLLMQNSLNMEVSDVISTYVYRLGIRNAQFSYTTAIGLANSLVNALILVIVNFVAGRLGETSLW